MPFSWIRRVHPTLDVMMGRCLQAVEGLADYIAHSALRVQQTPARAKQRWAHIR